MTKFPVLEHHFLYLERPFPVLVNEQTKFKGPILIKQSRIIWGVPELETANARVNRSISKDF